MFVLTSRIVYAAAVIAVLAWANLLLGLVYANCCVPDSPPNPVIMFSGKGLTSLLVELASFGIGCLGLLLVVIAFILSARSRTLAVAALGSAAVCVVCAALILF